jgi:hypothetical protein
MVHLNIVHDRHGVRRTADRARLRVAENGWSPKAPQVAQWGVGSDGKLVCRWTLDRDD